MKTNHDGTVTLNAYDTWTFCGACGQRVTGDSIHTCSPQLKELTDEEIIAVGNAVVNHIDSNEGWIEFARAILRKAQEK
jgi:succinate dehydrogenase/fumarate reductase-like Fe-S protein